MRTLSGVLFLLAIAPCAPAQTERGAAPTEFEVVALKAYVPPPPTNGFRAAFGMRGGPGSSDPGQITWTGATVRGLIMTAFGVKSYQVTGPEWLDSDRYTITAKVPTGATKDDVKLMWQKFLHDRFGLKAHTETKEIAVFEILPGKGANKLKESAPVTDPPKPVAATSGPVGAPPPPPPPPSLGRMERGPDGCPVWPGGRSGTSFMMMPGRVQLCAGNASLDDLAGILTNQLPRPVFNKTGLTGKYDIRLEFEPESQAGMGVMPSGAALPSAAGGAGPDTNSQFRSEPAPPITAAIQNQLGLKLEAKKAPAEMVVIDKIERTPIEN